MFTRSELESKTLKELKDLAARYGVKPVGNPGYKISWITPLLAFPVQAIQQFKANKRGLKNLSLRSFEALGTIFNELGEPTDEQAALIRVPKLLEEIRIRRESRRTDVEWPDSTALIREDRDR